MLTWGNYRTTFSNEEIVTALVREGKLSGNMLAFFSSLDAPRKRNLIAQAEELRSAEAHVRARGQGDHSS